jgi:tetratricopeptide (TPR) repeat protein
MPFDKFTLCPCGSGKKAKFCCSKDLIHEFETIDRMMVGDQRLAALQRIDLLLQSHPDLPCLLSAKAEAHLHLNEWEKLSDTASRMAAKQSDSTRSHAFLAIAAAAMDNPEQGIEHLQDAADLLRDNTIDPYTLQAFAMVGSALQNVGALVAARGHLVFYTVVASRNSEQAAVPLTRFDSSPRIPLLIKHQFDADPPAENSPIAADYERAISLVAQGRFRAATVELRKLAEKYPKEPAVLVNLATQLGWLNRGEEAADFWRRYSLLPGTDHETAVEAEALTQIVADQPLSDAVTSTMVTYQLENVDALLERAATVARLVRAPVDPQELVEEGQPPPRGRIPVPRPTAAEGPRPAATRPVACGGRRSTGIRTANGPSAPSGVYRRKNCRRGTCHQATARTGRADGRNGAARAGFRFQFHLAHDPVVPPAGIFPNKSAKSSRRAWSPSRRGRRCWRNGRVSQTSCSTASRPTTRPPISICGCASKP